MDQNYPHHATHVRIGVLSTAILLTVAFHFLVAERWFGMGLAIFAILLVIGIHVIDVLAAMDEIEFYPERVNGNVNIVGNPLTLDLPIDNIDGSVVVSFGMIKAFGNMPKHNGKDLDISQAGIDALLPAGLDIDGAVAVPQFVGQTSNELAKDAYTKGYAVRYITVPAPLDKKALVPPCGTEENPYAPSSAVIR